jgi:hypothetical protein
VTLDWRRQRAVVLESDDWGLCAWSPDDEAFRALSETPAFRDAVGMRYGRSTRERAQDVRALCELLAAYPGPGGIPPVWQANTVMASPDFAAIAAGSYDATEIPLVFFPEAPPRWQRPGLWEACRAAIESGIWWPELHGLHHIPATAWMAALRRGDPDARTALEHECLVCRTTQAGSEYAASEPDAGRRARLLEAHRRFERVFSRTAVSFCPPDYMWDAALEREARTLGLRVLQGWAEQAGISWARRKLRGARWPRRHGALFAMPARIAFEPRGDGSADAPLGARRVSVRVRAAWRAGRPAVVSSHRLNYAHLDTGWVEAGRAQLRMLVADLAAAGATFLTDAEVLGLHQAGWSFRPAGSGRGLLRVRRAPEASLRLPLPAGENGAEARRAGGEAIAARVESGALSIQAPPGDYWIEWRRTG